jgi:hypothetical protein
MHVIFAKGSLDEAAKAQLNATLWEIALRWEGIEATEEAASVAWVFLDERPEGHVSVGGKPPGQSIYRLNVRVMVGFMDQERIDRMVAELTKAVLRRMGKSVTAIRECSVLSRRSRAVPGVLTVRYGRRSSRRRHWA